MALTSSVHVECVFLTATRRKRTLLQVSVGMDRHLANEGCRIEQQE